MSIASDEDLEVSVPLYIELFKTRDDCFAMQRPDGAYSPIHKEFGEKEVNQHVSGERTFGQYLVKPVKNTVRFAAIDNDIDDDSDAPLENALAAAVLEKKRAINWGLRPNQVWIEFSGRRGYHTWFFFDPPVQAALAKQFLERLVGGNEGENRMSVAIDGGHHEVFPKQTALIEGEYGNLIKTPFGFHQKTGNRMLFVDDDGTPVDDQNAILRAALRNRIEPDVVGGILEEFGDDTEELVAKSKADAANRGQRIEDVVDSALDIRPCIERALRGEATTPDDQRGQLRGVTGHQMRLAAATELLNNGVSVDDAVEYFSHFENFDEQITREKLEEIKRLGYKPWRCETLRDKCGAYVDGCACPKTSEIDPVRSMELNHERYSDKWRHNE